MHPRIELNEVVYHQTERLNLKKTSQRNQEIKINRFG